MESQLHKQLKLAAVNWFVNNDNFTIHSIDEEAPHYNQPDEILNNEEVGDKENKRPDAILFHSVDQHHLIIEAKIGEDDLLTEHSLTQFILFSNLENPANKKPAILLIVVPRDKVDTTFESLNYYPILTERINNKRLQILGF